MTSNTLGRNAARPQRETTRNVREKYENLCLLAGPTMTTGDAPKLQRAFHLAIDASNKEPPQSTTHTVPAIEVANIVAEELGLSYLPIICALLHGATKGVCPTALQDEFGKDVAQTLHSLTKLDAMLRAHQSLTAPKILDLLVVLLEEPRSFLIRMAANIYQMRTLPTLTADQQTSVLAQARCLFMPIAHRLGLNEIKATLEDLYLKYTDAETFYAIKKQVKPTKEARKELIQRFQQPIHVALQQQAIAYQIKARVKTIASIHNKMTTLGVPFTQIYDLFAIRIILYPTLAQEKNSCWQVHNTVTDLYQAHPEKLRNWLDYPRPNGYQALHTTVMAPDGVWVEVQIRTQRMDEKAEQGTAAHWRYKEMDTNLSMATLAPQLERLNAYVVKHVRRRDEFIDTI